MTIPSTATLREQIGAAEDGLGGVVVPKQLFLGLLDALDVCPQPMGINESCTCPEAQRTIAGLEDDVDSLAHESDLLLARHERAIRWAWAAEREASNLRKALELAQAELSKWWPACLEHEPGDCEPDALCLYCSGEAALREITATLARARRPRPGEPGGG